MSKRKSTPPSSVPIGTIETNTGDQYLVGNRKGDGGSGVVYSACSIEDERDVVAVKFYLVPNQLSAFGTTAQAFWMVGDADEHSYNSERMALRQLQHPGIQEVLGWGILEDASAKLAQETSSYLIPSDNRVRFLVSRFIKGKNIHEWIANLRQRAQTANAPERHRIRTLIVNCLVDLVDALVYLHEERHHQHSDIRPENILIHEASERPILIDFGYSQLFSSAFIADNPRTRVPPLRILNGPDELQREITSAFGGNHTDIDREVLAKLIFPGLDLYQFGLLLQQSLEETHGLQELLSPLDHAFLTLLAGDLVRWPIARSTRTSSIRAQLRKLSDGYWSAASAPHAPQLAPGQPIRRIALPSGSFLAPRLVERILETRSFRRLQRLKQLSLLDYVYPGATQTRFDHCLAVYSTAVDLVANLVRSPRFTKLFDTDSTGHLLITALLHDINHFPFLHYFQEIDVARSDSLDLFEFFVSGTASGDSPNIADLLTDAGLDPGKVLEVLRVQYDDISDPCQQVIKSIIDSGVDIDKLSYVDGDARATGVPFGLGVDRRALLSAADILLQPGLPDHPHWHLSFEPGALSAVESLLLARYWNFKRIYWHHTNRTIGAMVSHVLRKLRDAGQLTLSEYVTETIGSSDIQALTHLNNLYKRTFKEASILEGLESRRTGLFKRLLSVRAPWRRDGSETAEDSRRRKIYENLAALSDAQRASVIEEFSGNLQQVFPKLREPPIVLVDIPGRPLDKQMGQVFVARLDQSGAPIETIQSPFISTLQHEFLDLSRTVRLFMPQPARDALGKAAIAKSTPELERLLDSAITSKGQLSRSTVA